MINRVKKPELRALITCPSDRVTSMNGIVVHSQAPLGFVREADAVIIGSGRGTRDLARTPAIMEQLQLDPARQIIGAYCSATFLLAKLGLLGGLPAASCRRTDYARKIRRGGDTTRRRTG